MYSWRTHACSSDDGFSPLAYAAKFMEYTNECVVFINMHIKTDSWTCICFYNLLKLHYLQDNLMDQLATKSCFHLTDNLYGTITSVQEE